MTRKEEILKLLSGESQTTQSVNTAPSASVGGISRKDEILHLLKTGKPMDADYFTAELGKIPDFIKQSASDFKNYGYSSSDDVYKGIVSGVDNYKRTIENAKKYNPQWYEENKVNIDDTVKALDDVYNSYTNKKNMFGKYASEDEYNRDLYSYVYGDYTYDQLQREIALLSGSQRRQSATESAKTQKKIDALKTLLYTNNYTDKDSYTKALANINSEISRLESSDVPQVKVFVSDRSQAGGHYEMRDDPNYDTQLDYLKTTRAELEQKSKITDFTELPSKLGAANMAVFESNLDNYIHNPTGEEFKAVFEKMDTMPDGAEKDTLYYEGVPEIEDPVQFYLDNKDLIGENHQASSIGQYAIGLSVGETLGDLYWHARDFHWDQLKDEELLIYKYNLVKHGKEKALEYIRLLEPTLGQRYQAEVEKGFGDYMKEHGALAYIGLNALTVPMKMLGDVVSGIGLIDSYANGEANPYSQANALRVGVNAIRSETGKAIEENTDFTIGGRNVLAEAYNIGMSTADSTFGALAFKQGYSFVAGLGAAADMAEDIYDRGGSSNQVFWGGVAAGVAETLFEYVSIDKLLNDSKAVDTAKKYFVNILVQAGVEASEEVFTEITNKIFDEMIMDEKSEFNQKVKQLVDSGMSLDEAREQAFTDVVYDVVWAGVAGFVSGGISSGGFGAVGYFSNSKNNAEIGKSIADNPFAIVQLADYAQSLNDPAINKMLKGKPTDKNIGRIYNAVAENITNRFNNASNNNEVVDTYNDIINNTKLHPLIALTNELAEKQTRKYSKLYEADLGYIQSMEEGSDSGQQNPGQNLKNSIDDNNDDSEDTELDSVLPQVSAAAPEVDPIKDWAFKEHRVERLTDDQKYIRKVGEAFGRKVHFAHMDRWVKGKDGKRRLFSPNGMFDEKTGDIWINTSQTIPHDPLSFILKHELTEFAETNPDFYSKFMKAVLKSKVFESWLRKKTKSKTKTVDQMVAELANKEGSKRTDYNINQGPYQSVQEVYANFVGDMLFEKGNLTLDNLIDNLDAKSKSRFIQALLDIIDWLKQKLKGNKEITLELVRLETKYLRALNAAQKAWEQKQQTNEENVKQNLSPNSEGVTENADGELVAHSVGNGTVQFSLSTYETDGRSQLREYLKKCVSSDRLTQAEMDEMLDGIEEIYDICKEFKDKYAPFGSWSDAAVVRDTHGKPVFSVVTPNGEYKMNLDFSLVCKKRRTLDAVFNLMADEGILDEFELGQKSIVKINEIIRKYGFETACSLCFVDAKRFRQADVADSFVSLYNELVESLVRESERDSISRFDFSERGLNKEGKQGIDTWDDSRLDFSHLDKVMKEYGSKTVEHKAAKYIKAHPEARKQLIRGEFMSSEDFGAVKTKAPEIMKLYNSKKGTGGPKAAFGDVQYLNEIIKKARNWTPNKAYMVGGVRIQSFSDYVPRMIFDYVQMIYDLAATKLPAHAYTKEVLFVKQFGLTGIKINMSLIPAIAEDGIAPGLDKNGNYVWAGESFDFDTAIEIQNADGYTENCGTIAVGVSKEHILKLLRDPNIRMVIPYHKSGLNPIVAHMNKIDAFTDYTTLKTNPGGCQNTIDNKTGSAVKNDFNFNKALHDMGENGSPKAVAKQYLDWCAENDYMPKFAEFSKNANYYKLLEDFNLYDKSGKYAPQREVRTVFPTKESAFGSMKELIRQGLEEDAIVEGKRNEDLPKIVDEIKRVLPKTEAEISEEAVEQADTDLEARFSYSVSDKENTDFTAEMDALNEQYQNGEIDRADYLEQMNDLYRKAGETYGTIKQGETVTGNEDFSNPVPQSVDGKKQTRTHVRTVLEGGQLTEDMVEAIKQMLLHNKISYTPTSNQSNIDYAERAIKAGTAKGIWQRVVNGEQTPSAGDIAIGEALLKLAVERKDAVAVVALTAELSEVGTRVGQALQAFSLLKRMNGIGQLYYLQRSVDSLNKDLMKKHRKKAPVITIDPTMAQQLAEAKTPEDFDYTYGAILRDIGAQVPSTFLDKWNAWRYMAMLFNPTTHIRNIFGNAIFSPSVKLKDTLGWLGERLLPKDQRTKSVIISKVYKDFARDDFKNVESILKGTGKMNPRMGIQDNKKVFKTRWLEWMRQKNFDLLEAEDAIFLKGHYVRAFGGYLQARKIDVKTATADVITKAREYAIGEALKATYRDTSELANLISRLSNKNAIANVLLEGILPFKKTPINIVKRGFEYSPYGLLKTLSKGLYDLKKGNITASQWIDGLAANLTGVGIFALGYFLSSMGVVKGAIGDDEEDWFDRMLGMQEYSIEIGGFSYTMDWAAPACMPFFMGVTTQETAEEEGNADFISATIDALGNGLEPYINMSMLSGIRDVIESTKYSDSSDIVQTVASDIILSYFSQALPTIGSKVSNLFVEDRRTSYIDKTSWMPKIMQQALDKVYGKVPWFANQRANYINAWGEKESNGGFFRRFLQNFVSPGYISDVEVDRIDEEVKRLAESTGEQSVFPDKPKKYVKFKGYTKDLTAEEYEDYAIEVGQASADYVSDCVRNAEYKKLTDEQKVEVITNLYAYANAKAKAKLSYTYNEVNAMYNGEITKAMWNKYNSKTRKALVNEYFLDKYQKPYQAERNGGSVIDYYITKAKE